MTEVKRYRYPSGLTVTYERDRFGNLRAVDYEAGPMAGSATRPVGPLSPFVRRALARELPAADMTGHKAVVL